MANRLEVGQIVRVRSRQYLVEEVTAPDSTHPQGDTAVRLACLDDDAQGQELQVFWEREIDAQVIGASTWDIVANRGFDEAKKFSAYLHTLRWNCVTSTDPKLFQAPYRAGIEVKSYQLEPLRKALLMPRVSLFIADDVGLGKTIEAGLILREMLMRQKVRRVVIACPPSVVLQWQEEMEKRFGLIFTVYDRDFVATKRRERGYGINPWHLHNRFIISHSLLRDENYTVGLREWLGDFNPASMLILDEAHNVAPASSSRYAIDSQLTKVLRDIAPRFEHKLFLSATPHNGHSNSFAALLEMLDPQRFCRGVSVSGKSGKKLLDAVMVRRLKKDLREIGETDFPKRHVLPIAVDNLPENAPELELSRLLQEYRVCREQRLKDAKKSEQRSAMLVMISLQKRLLSSIEAFARTLKVHRQGLEKKASKKSSLNDDFSLLGDSLNYDDDRAELSETEVMAEEDAQMLAASAIAIAENISARELELLDRMTAIAERSRYEPDGRIKKLIAWIRDNLCHDLGQAGAKWNNRRVLIFTEYTDTKRYLEEQIKAAIDGSDLAHKRIDTFHGGMGDDCREAIKAAFNHDPADAHLRILIATDAAREGINLQNYCADLFHFDIPWNPSRMEQRNGRIDRKLQREAEVRCHYFVLPQRPEDRVLAVLVQKTETIQAELGSLSPVIEKNISKLLEGGIWAKDAKAENSIKEAIDKADTADINDEQSQTKKVAILEELEISRPELQQLRQQKEDLENMLKKAREWLTLDDRHFRETLSASLEILGAQPLGAINAEDALKSSDTARWYFPEDAANADPTWLAALDSLRSPRQKGQKLWEWRNESPIRPIVFRDPQSLDGEVVHLHLEHRLVQRLLGRFLSQGFLHDELTRACVCHTRETIPKVIALGRLSLYGDRATRLHDEIVAVAAEWNDPALRGRSKLRPLGEDNKKDVLRELENVFATPSLCNISQAHQDQFKAYAARDVEELIPHLENRAETLTERAKRLLTKRGDDEAADMQKLLGEQRDRILKQQSQYKTQQLSLFSAEEQRQLDADLKHWEKRLLQLEQEIIAEPQRIQKVYEVKASRIEPVGLVYLYPITS
jgi:ERCC4-related helicase